MIDVLLARDSTAHCARAESERLFKLQEFVTMRRDSFLLSLLPLLTIVFMGCGKDADVKNREPVAPVSGTVTFKGSPVSGATVTFHPGQGKSSAFGTTDAEGRFNLTTFGSADGAVIGTHQVTITKIAAAAASDAVSQDDPNYQPPAETDTNPDRPAPRPANELPAKYATPAVSGLTAEVKAGEGNDFKFELNE